MWYDRPRCEYRPAPSVSTILTPRACQRRFCNFAVHFYTAFLALTVLGVYWNNSTLRAFTSALPAFYLPATPKGHAYLTAAHGISLPWPSFQSGCPTCWPSSCLAWPPLSFGRSTVTSTQTRASCAGACAARWCPGPIPCLIVAQHPLCNLFHYPIRAKTAQSPLRLSTIALSLSLLTVVVCIIFLSRRTASSTPAPSAAARRWDVP